MNKLIWSLPEGVHVVIRVLTHREMVLGPGGLWWEWIEKPKEKTEKEGGNGQSDRE